MDDELHDHSPLLSAFGGKYLVMQRCQSCKSMECSNEDFFGLQFRSFTSEDTNHIYNMRREFGSDAGIMNSMWDVMKPFSYFWSTIWDVTFEDYLASHLLNDLMEKREDKEFCDKCNQEVSFDTVYKLSELPNNLLVTFRYTDSRMDEHVRLRQYLNLDFSKSIPIKFIKSMNNPFTEEEYKGSLQYSAKSIVAYDQKNSPESCFITYTKSDEGKWRKYSRSTYQEVDVKEVEGVYHPYAVIYERIWEPEKERISIIDSITADETVPVNDKMYG